MKYFLLLLLAFSVNVFADTYAEINGLTVNSAIHRLLNKYYSENTYKFDPVRENENRSNYDRLLEPKPTFEELQEKLVLYKAYLTAEEDARLAELARVNALKDRIRAIGGKYGNYNSLSGIHEQMVRCGFIGNIPILIRKFIKNNDLEKIECLETEYAKMQSEQTAEQAEKDERTTDIQQIKTAINLIKDSDLPAWHKKLLIRLVKELKE